MSSWITKSCAVISESARKAAKDRQASLTKPAGSLGELEAIAEQFAAWQNNSTPTLDNIMVRVFAADHGVCAQNVSAFPQAVTAQMVANFIQGGAAISVLSKAVSADFSVVTMGLANPLPEMDSNKLIRCDIAKGTADFSQAAAMTADQLKAALNTGRQVIEDKVTSAKSIELFIGGEMGIGNTTSASALLTVLLDIDAVQASGPGTGVDDAGVLRKADVIEKAIALHSPQDAEQALQTLGGFEIAALVGAYIAAAQNGIPSLVDGFICTTAALIATRINPSCRNWLMFSHQSAEPAHVKALMALSAKPLLSLGMRLGEGSGAAVALPIIRSALLLHNNMATFEEASVAGKS